LQLLNFSKLKPHPNLLLLYGVVTIDKRLHFVSEFCDKGSLDALHGKEDLTSPDRFWQIVGGVLKGIAAFHKSGLVHRDIACRNLFMKADKSVVLGDYGLSRSGKGNSTIYMQTDQTTKLPWAWSAPESLIQKEFSQKSDVWMFGVTVWEILNKGKQPHFELGGPREYIEELKKGKMPLKLNQDSSLPPRAEALIKRCFTFTIKRPELKNEKPLASWSKHDVVDFIKGFVHVENKRWNECIEVILKEDLDYSMLGDCDVEILCELGIPKICAVNLLRKLKKVSEGENSSMAKGNENEKVSVDATVRKHGTKLKGF